MVSCVNIIWVVGKWDFWWIENWWIVNLLGFGSQADWWIVNLFSSFFWNIDKQSTFWAILDNLKCTLCLIEQDYSGQPSFQRLSTRTLTLIFRMMLKMMDIESETRSNLRWIIISKGKTRRNDNFKLIFIISEPRRLQNDNFEPFFNSKW